MWEAKALGWKPFRSTGAPLDLISIYTLYVTGGTAVQRTFERKIAIQVLQGCCSILEYSEMLCSIHNSCA